MTSRKGSNHKEMTVLYYSDGHGGLPGMFGDESTLVEELTLCARPVRRGVSGNGRSS